MNNIRGNSKGDKSCGRGMGAAIKRDLSLIINFTFNDKNLKILSILKF